MTETTDQTGPTTPKKLFKSRKDRMVDGVCGGLAAYAGIDVTLVRLVTVLLALLGGIGVIAYLAAVLIVPREPVEVVAGAEGGAGAAEAGPPADEGRHRHVLVWGILLVVAGIVLMGFSFKLFDFLSWRWWNHIGRGLWPLSALLSGLILILFPWLSGLFGKIGDREPAWFRSTTDRKILGVCGGLAENIKADSNLIRFLWVAVIVLTFGLGLLVYFVVALFLPEKAAA